MSLKHMILGSIRELPAHGYELLRKLFQDFSDQGPEVFGSQLYTLLHKMEAEGLIEYEVVDQAKGPSRKIVKITLRGEAEFDHWLKSEDEEIEYTRYDFFSKYRFLYKVNHFNKRSRREILEKVGKQIRQMEEKLANFENAKADMVVRQVDQFRIFIIQYGIEIQKTKIAWLKNLREAVLAAGDNSAGVVGQESELQ